MKILSNNDGNNFLSNLIESNENFAVSRLGIIELDCLLLSLLNNPIPQQLSYLLQNNAGLYGDNFCYDFYHEYKIAVQNCNIHAIWDDTNLMNKQLPVIESLSPYSTKVLNRSVEPFYFDNPWSSKLKNKKVLVISPFEHSIKSQFLHNRKNLWTNDVLPEFELITYKSVQSIGGQGPDKSWLESLNRMKSEITQIDFDIALLGCGAYGVPLVSYIYSELNKSAIYIGGALQIMFGIKGKRWDDHEIISKFYNDNWIRPSEYETPAVSNTIEGGCYW